MTGYESREKCKQNANQAARVFSRFTMTFPFATRHNGNDTQKFPLDFSCPRNTHRYPSRVEALASRVASDHLEFELVTKQFLCPSKAQQQFQKGVVGVGCRCASVTDKCQLLRSCHSLCHCNSHPCHCIYILFFFCTQMLALVMRK